MNKRRRKTKIEILTDEIFQYFFPQTIYENKSHEGLHNLLMFPDYLFPGFIESLFDQAKLKCPFRSEDFLIEFAVSWDYLGLEIQIQNHNFTNVQSVYVMFQPPTEADSAISDVAYYYISEESDGTLSCFYVGENLKIELCCENIPDFDFAQDVIDEHYFENYLDKAENYEGIEALIGHV